MNQSLSNLKILITGANGYIGRTIVQYLIENRKCNLLLLDQHFDEIPIYANPKVELVKHDLIFPFANVVSDIDIVIHLASIVGETACTKNIEYAFQVNTIGTNTIIQNINRNNLKHFILLSTCNIYSFTNPMPVDETGEIETNGIYNTTKLSAEAIVNKYFMNSNTTFHICRASNVYGPGQKTSTVINYILNQIVNDKSIELEAPGNQRSFIFIDDLITGIITLMDKKTESGIYNVAGDESIKIGDIPNICAELLNKPFTFYGDNKNGDVLIVNNSKMKQLNWKPNVNIKTGLKICLDRLLINNSHSINCSN